MRLWTALAASILFSTPVFAQETALGADFRKEGERFGESCGSFKLAGCAQLLFTDHPLHIAVGSLAPLNGFGSGIAFTTHYTPNESWRIFLERRCGSDAERVVACRRVHERCSDPAQDDWRSHRFLQYSRLKPGGFTRYAGVPRVRAEHVSQQNFLLRLRAKHDDDPSLFGMSEAIVGGNVVWPVSRRFSLSLLGEVNGRFSSVRPSRQTGEISIEQANNETTAPGLSNQPGYAQFGQGIRFRPSLVNGYVRLDYTASFQEWIASNSTFSFRRFRADLSHEFPLYRNTRSLLPREYNGPDTCSSDPNALRCPPISRNLEGSFGFRLLYTSSYTSAGSVVPFYLDPTIGGSDLNGMTLLPSYADYRFRGPNMLVVRGSFEHSIYKWPIGAKFMVDGGRVASRPGLLGFNHFAHSYAAGLTVRAGGLPLIDLLFAWGGGESTHTIANVSASLLGGTARPSLY